MMKMTISPTIESLHVKKVAPTFCRTFGSTVLHRWPHRRFVFSERSNIAGQVIGLPLAFITDQILSKSSSVMI